MSKKFIWLVLLIFSVVLTVTLLLSWLIDDFWGGYGVEFAGVALEVFIIYLVIDTQIKRAENKKHYSKRQPVMAKIREHVTSLHVFTFRSLNAGLAHLEAFESGALKCERYTNVDDSVLPKSNIKKLNDLLSHASSHLDIDEYAQLLDYIGYMEDLIGLTDWIKAHPILQKDTPHEERKISNMYYTTFISVEAFEGAAHVYEWVRDNTKPSTKPFFNTPIMKHLEDTLPDVTEMLNLARKLKSINVVESIEEDSNNVST